MDLYTTQAQLLEEPVAVAAGRPDPRPDPRPGPSTDPRPRPGTVVTATVETTDEARGGSLLGVLAP